MSTKTKNEVTYKYTGILDVASTVREIRDSKIKEGGYKGHSKYLWDALELRNKGYDNREIAKELTAKHNVTVNAQYIKRLFDSYGIESNEPKYKAHGRAKTEIVLLDKETFDTVDIESLKTGQQPVKVLKDLFGSRVGNIEYDTDYMLQKVWDASYAHYMNK